LSTSALDQFLVDLQQELLSRASLDGEETLLANAFTTWAIETLSDAGELDDASECYFETRGARISALGADPDGTSIDLIAAIHTGATTATTVPKSEVDTAFRRLKGFFERCRQSLHLQIEEASPAFDAALTVNELLPSLGRIRLFVVTDGVTSERRRDSEEDAGIVFTYSVWDAERFARLISSGAGHEPIEINIEERYGSPLACLAPQSDGHEEYRSYLAIIPGVVLADLYDEYGGRLLEQNVRAFLSTRVKVNRGIRDTIVSEPDRFLAYNNGISAVAARVETRALPDGGLGITRLHDLQIVNGGQTTASIHAAAKRDHADISHVDVQAKITVIDQEEEYATIVRDISRFANTQNRINEADLAANDPFHVRVEELSRTVWAPAADGGQRMTRWFYERARGSYQEALRRERTPARQAQFKRDHPTHQKFSKTDLAKYENSWDQLPYLVSQGAQKNFAHFMRRVAERRGFVPDVEYFQELIAKAILFRQALKIATALKFPAYRANVVTYSVAYLSNRTMQRIDLQSIWRHQHVPDVVAGLLETIEPIVFESITTPPGSRNIGEWCKKEECWASVKELDVALPRQLDEILIDVSRPTKEARVGGINVATDDEADDVRRAAAISGDDWKALARWASQTGNLQAWQRGIVYDIGKRLSRGLDPSPKQAHQGLIALEEAERRGFSLNGLADR
jgi:hypothetical protein